MKLFKYGVAGFVLMLTGCANMPANIPSADNKTSPIASQAQTIPTEAQQHQATLAVVSDFKIEGRMSVQSQGYGTVGNIHWIHAPAYDAIDLYSPLGNKIAAIVKNADGVSLTSQDGKVIRAQSAETLTDLTLGWPLPFSKLSDWIVGRPANGVVSSFAWDEQGKLSKMTQDGWEISYLQYQTEGQPVLPSKINLRHPKMNLRMVIESWDTTAQTVPQQTVPQQTELQQTELQQTIYCTRLSGL